MATVNPQKTNKPSKGGHLIRGAISIAWVGHLWEVFRGSLPYFPVEEQSTYENLFEESFDCFNFEKIALQLLLSVGILHPSKKLERSTEAQALLKGM